MKSVNNKLDPSQRSWELCLKNLKSLWKMRLVQEVGYIDFRVVLNILIQTRIIPSWLLFRKMIISQLDTGPPVRFCYCHSTQYACFLWHYFGKGWFSVLKCRRQSIKSIFAYFNIEGTLWLPFQWSVETTCYDSNRIA